MTRKAHIDSDQIPRPPLGRTGVEVSALALGGYNLGLVKTQREAIPISSKHSTVRPGVSNMDSRRSRELAT